VGGAAGAPAADAGPPDAGAADAGPPDAGAAEAGAADGGAAEAGPPDAGAAEAGAASAGIANADATATTTATTARDGDLTHHDGHPAGIRTLLTSNLAASRRRSHGRRQAIRPAGGRHPAPGICSKAVNQRETDPRRRDQAVLGGGISRGLVLLLAAACGATVANLYYAQPLLHTLAHAFSVSEGTAGLLITITQIGYVLGLAFLVPSGDLHERRGLICVTLMVTAAGLAVAALAPGFVVFAAALGVVGVAATAAQVIVPMSASLATEADRGGVVGTVMSGLLIGILLARTISGLLASALGWRLVFWIGAALMVALTLTLWSRLPKVPPTTDISYGRVLRSVLSLVAAEPVLRLRMAIGFFSFGCFSALWTALAFLLSGPPFDYGNGVIGLFGLAGVAGAAAATGAGRLADRGHVRLATWTTAVLTLASWPILLAGKSSVIWLIVGIAVLDLGVQGIHISNQSAIYALAPEARSRLTTAYMVSFFLGGAALSAITSALYSSDGWDGVCVIGAASALAALSLWAAAELRTRARRTPQLAGGR
jgi:predicted MFS family arabinose efflux permease